MVTVAAIIILLLAAFLIYAATRPNSFRMARTVTVNASPEKIFPHVNDFHQWTAWSPYENIDPALKRSYSGGASGVGSVYEWEGNTKVGKGRMEITDATSPSRVTIKLDFEKPMKAHNTAEFTMEPKGSTTDVTWAMYGPNTFMTKVMHIFISMDKLVGKDFEKGLANLKAVAER